MSQLHDTNREELRDLRRRLEAGARLVCVGYSGFGDMDILPVLRECAKEVQWFDKPGFKAPIDADVFVHNLESADNLLTRWAGVAEQPSFTKDEDGEHTNTVQMRARRMFGRFSTAVIMRVLASVAHENRFGALGLRVYRKLQELEGGDAVSDHELAVALERAGERRQAGIYLSRAADFAPSPIERTQLRAGAAFCLRQVGDLHGAIAEYDAGRETLLDGGAVLYSFADQILRGRVGAYAKLAGRASSIDKRREVLDTAHVDRDLRMLRQHEDLKDERPGRLELLLELEQLEVDILRSRSPATLSKRSKELWDWAMRTQDLEIEARAARVAAAARPGVGRGLALRTLMRVRRTGASRRDVPKLLGAIVLSLIPSLPPGWRLLDPIAILKLRFRESH